MSLENTDDLFREAVLVLQGKINFQNFFDIFQPETLWCISYYLSTWNTKWIRKIYDL